MAIDYSKWDNKYKVSSDDVKSIEKNNKKDFDKVPYGQYEVSIKKLELISNSNDDPMVVCWFKILDGKYKNSMIFMNQVVSQGFQIHLANEFLRSIADGPDAPTITFESYSQYAQLIMDVAEYIDGKFEYALNYGQTPKGYDTFEIKEIFELE